MKRGPSRRTYHTHTPLCVFGAFLVAQGCCTYYRRHLVSWSWLASSDYSISANAQWMIRMKMIQLYVLSQTPVLIYVSTHAQLSPVSMRSGTYVDGEPVTSLCGTLSFSPHKYIVNTTPSVTVPIYLFMHSHNCSCSLSAWALAPSLCRLACSRNRHRNDRSVRELCIK